MMDRSSLLASRMCIVGRDMIYNFKFILVDKKIENLYDMYDLLLKGYGRNCIYIMMLLEGF